MRHYDVYRPLAVMHNTAGTFMICAEKDDDLTKYWVFTVVTVTFQIRLFAEDIMDNIIIRYNNKILYLQYLQNVVCNINVQGRIPFKS